MSSKTEEPMEVVAEIDEGLYSRQLYVMGHEAQRRMAASNVLLVGMNGLGVEVAKNVILAGVKSVSLYDQKLVSFEDLSSQFYLTEADVGSPRVNITASKLAELNPYVPVKVIGGVLGPEIIASFNVLVLIETTINEQLQISDFCHQNGISLIMADVYGAYGSIFCDFGDSFTVYDVNGEIAPSSMITSITK
eukprot:gene46967-62879_t